MKFIITTILFLHIITNTLLYSHDYIENLEHYSYFIGTEEPPEDWNQADFDDTSWDTASFHIGYGYEDMAKTVDPVASLYVRSKFYAENVSEIEALNLAVEFDDGFVAYINGTEVARKNMGKAGTPTTYDQLTERSHESEYFNRYSVPGLYLDKSVVNSCIKNGENTLAIEVHNDSINGSDLFLYALLYDLTDYDYNFYDIRSRYVRQVELDSSYLPIVIIETDEYGIPGRRYEVIARMKIINNGEGNYNKPDDTNYEYNGRIRIEVRGESSSDFPKKSYDLETQLENGQNFNVPLLGMPRENDWILQGPYADKSQIRNTLVYELGRKQGHWNPRSEFVELILNGELMGLYCFREKIKRDSCRVDLANLRTEDIDGMQLTGGYIFKYDKGSSSIQIVYPNSDKLQEEQDNYIRDYMKEYYEVLNSNDFLDPETGYRKYINDSSLIDYVVINELTKNADSYLYSTYFHKDRDDHDGRIKFGPLWDYDLGFGNTIFQNGDKRTGWQFAVPTNNRLKLTRLFQDTGLVELFQDEWFRQRELYLNDDSIFNRIDELVEYLQPAIERNYLVWPIIDESLFWPAYMVSDYEEEINTLKSYIADRTTWIDDAIKDLYYEVYYPPVNNINQYLESLTASIYPNPFSDRFVMDLNILSDGQLNVDLVYVTGQKYRVVENTWINAGKNQFYYSDNQDLPAGLYLLLINFNGETIYTGKLLKQ